MCGFCCVCLADRKKRLEHFAKRRDFRATRTVLAAWLQRRNERAAVRTKVRLWRVARAFVPWRSVALYRYGMKQRLLSYRAKRDLALRREFFSVRRTRIRTRSAVCLLPACLLLARCLPRSHV